MEAKFGYNNPIGFCTAKIYNADGTEELCKCGKPAQNVFIGFNAYMPRCNECLKENEQNIVENISEN